jgi:hypothetical protein
MHVVLRAAISLLVAIVAFGIATVGITAALQPRIEFSLLVGLPVGVFAGLTALFAAYVRLRYRDERAKESPSWSMRRWSRAAVAAVLALVVVTALGLALYALGSLGFAVGVLTVGLPVTVPVAAVAGYLTPDTGIDDESGSRPSAP